MNDNDRRRNVPPHPNRSRLFPAIHSKTGAPTSAVTAPTGNSPPGKIFCAPKSATVKSTAPTRPEIGRLFRKSGPVINRAMCGATSPTNPIIPTLPTATPTITVPTPKTLAANCFGSTPIRPAWSPSSVTTFNALVLTYKTGQPRTKTPTKAPTFGQYIGVMLPKSHRNTWFVSCPAISKSRVKTADNMLPTTTPAKSSRTTSSRPLNPPAKTKTANKVNIPPSAPAPNITAPPSTVDHPTKTTRVPAAADPLATPNT